MSGEDWKLVPVQRDGFIITRIVQKSFGEMLGLSK